MVPFIDPPSPCLLPLVPSSNTEVTSLCNRTPIMLRTCKTMMSHDTNLPGRLSGMLLYTPLSMLHMLHMLHSTQHATHVASIESLVHRMHCSVLGAALTGLWLTLSMKPSPEASKKRKVSCACKDSGCALLRVPCAPWHKQLQPRQVQNLKPTMLNDLMISASSLVALSPSCRMEM